jgi:hypothetical protein
MLARWEALADQLGEEPDLDDDGIPDSPLPDDESAAPLPPPIEIRPAPGVKSSRPRAPLVIAPPVPNTGRPGF